MRKWITVMMILIQICHNRVGPFGAGPSTIINIYITIVLLFISFIDQVAETLETHIV